MKAVALIIGIALLAIGIAGFVPALNNDGVVFGFMPMDTVRSVLFALTGLAGIALGMSNRRPMVPSTTVKSGDMRDFK